MFPTDWCQFWEHSFLRNRILLNNTIKLKKLQSRKKQLTFHHREYTIFSEWKTKHPQPAECRQTINRHTLLELHTNSNNLWTLCILCTDVSTFCRVLYRWAKFVFTLLAFGFIRTLLLFFILTIKSSEHNNYYKGYKQQYRHDLWHIVL